MNNPLGRRHSLPHTPERSSIKSESLPFISVINHDLINALRMQALVKMPCFDDEDRRTVNAEVQQALLKLSEQEEQRISRQQRLCLLSFASEKGWMSKDSELFSYMVKKQKQLDS
jgi:hypothetical protein